MWAGIIFQIHVLWGRKSSRGVILSPSFIRRYLMFSWCSSSYEWGVKQLRQNMVHSGLEGISCHTTAHCWSRVHSRCSRHTNKISCLTLNRCDLPFENIVYCSCMLSTWKVTKGISCYITSLAFVGRQSRHLCSSEILFHEAPKACHSVLYFSSSIFHTFNRVYAANTLC